MNGNVKTFKDARNVLAQWHIATFSTADIDISKSKEVKIERDKMKIAMEKLEKVNNGHHGLGTVEELEERIATCESEIARISAECDERKKMYEDALKKGFDLVSKELVKAMATYVEDMSVKNETAMLSAVVTWFKDLGLEISTTDALAFTSKVGVRVTTNGQKARTSNHTCAIKGNAFKKLWLSIVCDNPSIKNVLPLYKWENVFEKKVAKRAEKTVADNK